MKTIQMIWIGILINYQEGKTMKIKKSDLDFMLDIILCYQEYFERDDNEEFYDEVEELYDKIYNLLYKDSN